MTSNGGKVLDINKAGWFGRFSQHYVIKSLFIILIQFLATTSSESKIYKVYIGSCKHRVQNDK